MKNRYALAVAVVAVILIVVFELTLMRSGAQYYGAIRTGNYTGSGADETIQTGLQTTRAFFITELADRGPSVSGYTTNTIQAEQRGAFLNGNRKDTGIAFETPQTVVISNRDFIASGSRYHWEARGE